MRNADRLGQFLASAPPPLTIRTNGSHKTVKVTPDLCTHQMEHDALIGSSMGKGKQQ